jgi:predicted amidophosphoribosyltransferase
MEPVASPGCETCGLALKETGGCGNPVCNWTVDERHFDRLWAISMRTGPMRDAISRYKYDGRTGWGQIFGRILVGFLAENRDAFGPYDVITPSPSYVGSGASREFDHTRRIVEAAAVEEPIAWPFRFDVITKTAATTTMVSASSWQHRRTIAEGELRDALQVIDQDAIAGARVLLVDDVFTEGLTTRQPT